MQWCAEYDRERMRSVDDSFCGYGWGGKRGWLLKKGGEFRGGRRDLERGGGLGASQKGLSEGWV